MDKIEKLLTGVYNQADILLLKKEIAKLWKKHRLSAKNANNFKLTQKDVVLISYANQIEKKGEEKLTTLRNLLHRHLKNQISIVHLLPFYPYTSDDGFSVTDYYAVDSALGSWKDIEQIASEFRLVFDAVINHSSAESNWFKEFMNNNKQYQNYYFEADVSKGYDNVVRPRASPLTHTFNSNGYTRKIWTTFSQDQVDLNFANPRVLIEILNLLLFYVSKGASIIRLDAIGFMWKEINTNCIHLPQTHALVKVMRSVIQELYPTVLLLTETNVPHKDNISYFGKGDEADMVYNFTLPPLLAFSILNQTTKKLTNWLTELNVPYKNVCYFNFLASHDGIGVMPVNDILNASELNVLIHSAEANGGKISYKSTGNGEQVPYEINCNLLSLLCGINADENLGIKRSLLAHAILLTMPGLPAIYFHSIFGSTNDLKGLNESGQNRRINREKFDFDKLEKLLKEKTTRQSKILNMIKKLIDIRKTELAFDPYGEFEVNSPTNGILALYRKSPAEPTSIYGYFNLTLNQIDVSIKQDQHWVDIITSTKYKDKLSLNPLGFVWLKKL